MTGFDAWIVDERGDARRTEAAIATAIAHAGLTVHDGVLFSWPATRRRPGLRPLENIPRTAALGDAFWGLYFGALYFGPHLTRVGTEASAPSRPAAVQSSAGCTLDAGWSAVGLCDPFNRELRTGLRAGCVAFVVLCDPAASTQISAALAEHPCRHVHAALSEDQLTKLHRVFAG